MKGFVKIDGLRLMFDVDDNVQVDKKYLHEFLNKINNCLQDKIDESIMFDNLEVDNAKVVEIEMN